MPRPKAATKIMAKRYRVGLRLRVPSEKIMGDRRLRRQKMRTRREILGEIATED